MSEKCATNGKRAGIKEKLKPTIFGDSSRELILMSYFLKGQKLFEKIALFIFNPFYLTALIKSDHG